LEVRERVNDRSINLPDGTGTDERRAESNPAETSEFTGDSGR
jgi:hypothetical protein